MQVPYISCRPRRDPLDEVVDVDSLRIGADLMQRFRNQPWPKGDVPVRPLGKVRFEVLRQLATFVVPALGLAAAYVFGGTSTLTYAVPLALLVGAALDYQLMNAIEKAKLADGLRDKGRYCRVRDLCVRLSLKPEEITMRRCAKLHTDFVRYTRKAEQEWADRRAPAEIFRRQAAEIRAGLRAPDRSNYAQVGAQTAALGVASGAVAYGYAEDDSASSAQFNHDFATFDTPDYQYTTGLPDFNVNGMPMMEGHAVDVTGTSYGSFE